MLGTEILAGDAAGEVLYADVGLSFWGGVDQETGTVIDHHHPLHGECLAGKVLAIPNGRGSCTGSQVMLELMLNGNAPAAILLRQPDDILALGVIVAEECFERTLPIVSLGEDGFELMAAAAYARVVGSEVHVGSSLKAVEDTTTATRPQDSTSFELPALSPTDHAMLNGEFGHAAQVAMRIVCRMARVQGAHELVDVTQAHIDACTYIGPGGLRFTQQLVEWGGQVRVPTTLNSVSVARGWRELGVSPALGEPASALADAYLALGATASFTCAPYLLDSAPDHGDQIVWGESNAVVFANSVLGARTQKYADYLDICSALVGRVPLSGFHLDDHRQARIVLDVRNLLDGRAHLDDAFYPTLGYLVGMKAEAVVPVITGLEAIAPSRDNLKAFSAAFGTTGSAPMYHIAGITPEAADVSAALGDAEETADVVELSHEDLAHSWHQLNGGSSAGGNDGSELAKVDVVALGNPHFSVEEFAQLAKLCAGAPQKHSDVSVVVTTNRKVLEEARVAGHLSVLEEFGVRVLTDTCWCMLTDEKDRSVWDGSIVPSSAQRLITNSAKYAHYAPGLVNREVSFTNLAGCVSAAHTGRAPAAPAWLRSHRPPKRMQPRGIHTAARHAAKFVARVR